MAAIKLIYKGQWHPLIHCGRGCPGSAGVAWWFVVEPLSRSFPRPHVPFVMLAGTNLWHEETNADEAPATTLTAIGKHTLNEAS